MKNIVVLISGRGSNMEAIVRSATEEGWDARVTAVLSNRPDAAGIAWAASRGIATEVVDHRATQLAAASCHRYPCHVLHRCRLGFGL